MTETCRIAVIHETADHWMRMQASYELAQARQERADARRQAELRFV